MRLCKRSQSPIAGGTTSNIVTQIRRNPADSDTVLGEDDTLFRVLHSRSAADTRANQLSGQQSIWKEEQS